MLEKRMTLADLTRRLADAVCARAAKGKNFGVVIVPEGLISCGRTRTAPRPARASRSSRSFIPEVASLIMELNDLFKHGVAAAEVAARLTPWSAALFGFLPPFVQGQLLLEREVHGSVQLSQVETERMLACLTEAELGRRSVRWRARGSGRATVVYEFPTRAAAGGHVQGRLLVPLPLRGVRGTFDAAHELRLCAGAGAGEDRRGARGDGMRRCGSGGWVVVVAVICVCVYVRGGGGGWRARLRSDGA